MKLNYENLEVYQISIQFLGFAFKTIQKIPHGYSFLSDQFKRASLSIPLNIAEGNGKLSAKEQGRFYQIAKGSANECGAILDAMITIQILDGGEHAKGKEFLYHIVCMLSKMCK